MSAILNRNVRRATATGRRVAVLTATTLGASIMLACTDRATTAPVNDAPVASTIDITDPGVVRDGDVLGLTAIVKDQRQRPMPNVPVRFEVADTSVAVVAPGNILRALREGTTELVAIAGGVQQRRPLVVVLHPATALDVPQPTYSLFVTAQQRIAATLRGLDGRVLAGRPLDWQSLNPAVARVDATGLVTAIAPGETIITVRYGTLVRHVPVQVAAYATTYRVLSIDGRPLPATVYEEVVTRDDGYQFTLVERLEAGQMAVGDRYDLTLTIAEIERHTFQGNTMERVMRRRTVRDAGALYYNWLDGSARLHSANIGGLTHELLPDLYGPRLNFRIGGTATIWSLGMRR